jgi:hypothetical protein
MSRCVGQVACDASKRIAPACDEVDRAIQIGAKGSSAGRQDRRDGNRKGSL